MARLRLHHGDTLIRPVVLARVQVAGPHKGNDAPELQPAALVDDVVELSETGGQLVKAKMGDGPYDNEDTAIAATNDATTAAVDESFYPEEGTELMTFGVTLKEHTVDKLDDLSASERQ